MPVIPEPEVKPELIETTDKLYKSEGKEVSLDEFVEKKILQVAGVPENPVPRKIAPMESQLEAGKRRR